MSDNYVWQPVAYGTLVFRDGGLGSFDRIVTPTESGLVVESYSGVYVTDVVLPDDLRLCRRVPMDGPVDAPAPLDAIRAIWRWIYRNNGYTMDGEMEIVYNWLRDKQQQEADDD